MKSNKHLASAIKPLTREESPDCIIFWDSETRAERDEYGEETAKPLHKPFLFCGLVYVRHKGKWNYLRPITALRPSTFLDRLRVCIKGHRHVWMVAHNANYDCLAAGLMSWLEQGELTWFKEKTGPREKIKAVPFFSTDKGSFHIQTWSGETRIDWIDSMNWFCNSVEELGRSVGMEKLPMPEADDLLPDWRTYCFRDCEIVAKAVLGLMSKMEELGFGMLRPTLASTAFAVYRRRFLRQTLDLPKSEFHRSQARQAYFGGWVWPYSLGEVGGELVQLDVVSMYPAVMIDGLFPTTLKTILSSPKLETLTSLMENNYLMALCAVEARSQPALVRIHKRTLPVLGLAVVWLTHEELARRLEKEEVVRVFKVHVYDQAPIFHDYIAALWKLRQEFTARGDEVGRLVVKLLMNSLYGKFGQRGAEYKYLTVPHSLKRMMPEFIVDVDGDVIETRHQAGGLLRIKRTAGESHYSHPAVAAAVTAKARWFLWDLIELIGRERVFYADTDSILTNAEGFLKIKELGFVGSELGKLKPEFFAEGGVIHGKKDYRLRCTCINRTTGPLFEVGCDHCGGQGFKGRLKGVSPRAEHLSRNSETAQLAMLAAGVSPAEFPHVEVFVSQRPAKMTQLFHGMEDGAVPWQEEVKVIRRRFTDGLISENGRTSFFTLQPGDYEVYCQSKRAWLDLGR